MGFVPFLLFFIFFFTASLPLFSHTADTLKQGQSIKDDGLQTVVSFNGTFELGFFTPGRSSGRYVGIWYNGITPQAVQWVANRDRPIITPSPGSFGFAKDGNLVVLDGDGTVLWSSNSSATNSSSLSVQLLNSGNLVLRSNDSDGGLITVWESFATPTDTFLPGMRIRKNTLLRSWRSSDDPGTGNYSVGLDPNGSAQIYIWNGSAIRWRSGPWNGQFFIGTRMRALFSYGFKVIVGEKGATYAMFTPFNNSLYRFVLQWDGMENITFLDVQTKQWSSFWTEPIRECELYNRCGRNAVCTDDGTPSLCGCLPGHVPASTKEWMNGNWSGGCLRRTVLACERNGTGAAGDDRFWKVEAVKLPDYHGVMPGTVADVTGCGDICRNNCSCKAYAFALGIGCMVWGGDLIDIHRATDEGDVDMYVKLAASEFSGKRSKKWIVPVAVTLLGAIILILFLFLLVKYRKKIQDWWRKGRKGEDQSIDYLRQFSRSTGDIGGSTEEGKSLELPLYNFDLLASATDKFSDSNKLGKGGFGDVYKGILPWGQEIAVKRLSKSSVQGQEEFKNEVILIAELQHRNLVRLQGCCIKNEEKMLVYEYMPNKSLDFFLFDPERKAMVDWKKRFNIIEGIARGLLYLHRDSRLRIVHRDLKASNILLDADMNPKISDFGMARIFGGDQNQENTNRVVGTYGYMSPEYAMEGLFSAKSDVYSFGVLMLEIISGRKSNSFFHILDHSPNLAGHAWRLWNEDRAMELLDPTISDSAIAHEVLRCIHVGLLCVQDRAMDRPVMSSIVFMLGNETAILLMPKQPIFSLEWSPSGTESTRADQDTRTSSDVTITTTAGR